MTNNKQLIYKCFLEDIPVLEIYQDGSYKVLTEDDPEVAELMKQETALAGAYLKTQGEESLTQEEIDEAFTNSHIPPLGSRGSISNEERLKRYVATRRRLIQEYGEWTLSEKNGDYCVASDAKYDSAFEILEKFGFSPTYDNPSTNCGFQEIMFFGEGEPWTWYSNRYKIKL